MAKMTFVNRAVFFLVLVGLLSCMAACSSEDKEFYEHIDYIIYDYNGAMSSSDDIYKKSNYQASAALHLSSAASIYSKAADDNVLNRYNDYLDEHLSKVIFEAVLEQDAKRTEPSYWLKSDSPLVQYYKNKPDTAADENSITTDYFVDTATTGEKNALEKAKSYLRSSAFSYEGLISQLEFNKFTHEEAVYGADNCGADWFEQAARKAESYLKSSAFSREGLISQLEYNKFTHEQAVYGVEQNGY